MIPDLQVGDGSSWVFHSLVCTVLRAWGGNASRCEQDWLILLRGPSSSPSQCGKPSPSLSPFWTLSSCGFLTSICCPQLQLVFNGLRDNVKKKKWNERFNFRHLGSGKHHYYWLNVSDVRKITVVLSSFFSLAGGSGLRGTFWWAVFLFPAWLGQPHM